MVQRIKRTNASRRVGVGLGDVNQVRSLIVSTAAAYGVNQDLALAVANQESGFDQTAVSPVGAIGVFQLMPATAAELGVDPYNLQQNIDGGVRYLKQLLARYSGDVSLALAAYNWGMGNLGKALAQWGVNWIYYLPAETRNYVSRITAAIGITSPVGTQNAGTAPGGELSGDKLAMLIFGGLFLFLLLR